MSVTESHLHVPTPGQLVSPRYGSALVSVARDLGAAHIDAGGAASFVVRAGLGHDPVPLGIIEAAMPDKVWLTQQEKIVDVVAGNTIRRWPRTSALTRPLLDAIPEQHTGPVFLHNQPAAARELRRLRPQAQQVVHLHNEVVKGWSMPARRSLIRDHGVVCVSKFIADRLVPGAADAGEVLVLLNGVDTDVFRPSVTEREPTVLFVGKVSAHKGPHLLIEAARMLHAEGLRFRVRIVGSSELGEMAELAPYERDLRRLSEPLGDLVDFTPFVDRTGIAEVYSGATIMVVPSDWDEPCALTLPEGMAAGLACVASRRGGLPELGGDAVLFFDPPDVIGLANHLRVLLTDEDERRARSAACRQRAEELSWSTRVHLLNAWLADRQGR